VLKTVRATRLHPLPRILLVSRKHETVWPFRNDLTDLDALWNERKILRHTISWHGGKESAGRLRIDEQGARRTRHRPPLHSRFEIRVVPLRPSRSNARRPGFARAGERRHAVRVNDDRDVARVRDVRGMAKQAKSRDVRRAAHTDRYRRAAGVAIQC